MAFLTKTGTILLLIFLLFTFYFIRVQPLATVDTYFHLSVGREVIETSRIPDSDNFVYGSQNTNYYSSEWLSGVIFFLLEKQFGLKGLLMPRMICSFIALYFLYKSLNLVTGNRKIIYFVILLMGYLLPFRLGSRPEMFSLAFLSVINYTLLFFLFKNKLSPVTYFLPVIFLVWPNLHGFSPIGIAIFTYFATIFFFRRKEFESKKSYFWMTFCTSLAFVLLQFPRVISFLHTNSFSKYITEWASLSDRIFPKGDLSYYFPQITLDIYIFLVFFVSFIALLLFNLKSLKKNEISSTVFYFFLVLLPFKFFRLITPVVLLSTPFLTFLFNNFSKNRSLNDKIEKYLVSFLSLILILIITISTLVSHQLGGEESQPFFPEKAADFIKTSLQTKKLFTIGFWDDYFIWKVPGIKTFSDVMTQYRTQVDLEDERQLHSPEQDVTDLLKKYNIDTVVNTQPNSASVVGSSLTPVYNSKDWKLVFVDDDTTIYIRKDVVNSQNIDLSYIHPELNTLNKYLPEDEEKAINQIRNLLSFDEKNDFARFQLINYYFISKKDLSTAKSLVEESRNVSPQKPFYSFILAAIYSNEKNCIQATAFAKESIKKNKYDTELKSAAKQILNNCL